MSLLVDPIQSVVLHALAVVGGWFMFQMRDVFNSRVLIKNISSIRLLEFMFWQLAIGYLYYTYVPYASHLLVVLLNCAFIVLIPFVIYRRKITHYGLELGALTIFIFIMVLGIIILTTPSGLYAVLFLEVLTIMGICAFLLGGGRFILISWLMKPSIVSRIKNYIFKG